MPNSPMDFVRSVLQPFEADFRKVINDAWKKLQEDRKHYPRNYLRTERTLMHDHMVTQAKSVFGGNSVFRFLEQYETLFMVVDDKVVIRLKKADSKGRTSNFPTPTALSYHDLQGTIEGIPPELPRVDLVYVPDQDNVDISGIRVVCYQRNVLLWYYDLRDDTPVAENIYDYNLSQQTVSAKEQQSMVFLKEEQNQKNSENSGEI